MLIRLFLSIMAAFCSAQAAYSPENWRDLMAQGHALQGACRYTEAARIFEHALATLKASQTATQIQLAENFQSLGAVYADAGMPTRAYDEYQRALAAIAQAEGKDSLDYAVVFATAVDVLRPAEIGNEAVSKLRNALARYEKTGSSDRLGTIRISLSRSLSQKKKLGEAETLLLDGLADLTKRPVKEPRQKAFFLNALTVLRFEQGRYEEALKLSSEHVRYLEETLGRNNASLVAAWNNVASAYVKLGRLSEAVSTYATALSLADKVLEPEDPARSSLAANYGFLLRKLGRKAEAKAFERKANEIRDNMKRLDGSGLTVSANAFRDRK
jgi:tetratricopeptide (TPR) repeat protein